MRYPLFKVHIPIDDTLLNIKDVLLSGFINEGKQVNDFRIALEEFLKVKNLVLTNSCTSALTMAYRLAGVSYNDEVITSPMTCVATNTPIVNIGAKIVWADIEETTGSLDAKDVEKKISSNTKAIVNVNWAGTPSNLDQLQLIGKKYNIPIIQDSAHALGATWKGQPISDFADYTCYSFQAIKHLTTGDGGAIICQNNKKFELAKKLKWFGYDRDAVKDEKGEWKGQRWDSDILESEVGYKFNMNNISGAIGLAQMDHIETILSAHKNNADFYNRFFKNSKFIKPLNLDKNANSSHWVYTCLFNYGEELRDELIKRLNDQGIAVGLVHLPNNIYTAFKSSDTYLPGTKKFSSTQLSLPCGWWLSESDCNFIADEVIRISKQII